VEVGQPPFRGSAKPGRRGRHPPVPRHLLGKEPVMRARLAALLARLPPSSLWPSRRPWPLPRLPTRRAPMERVGTTSCTSAG